MIFWNVYEMAGACLPVKRLWISSLEEAAIRDGFASLKDASCYKGIREAAVCRARADWLVGINMTRALSAKYNARLQAGRVQSPTLAMLVKRKDEVDGFEKEVYFKVCLKGSGIKAVSRDIGNEEEADEIATKCSSEAAVITKVEKRQNRENPPKLYDLTALQRDANRLYGYTAKQTLDLLQELYEGGAVTYPRTDSHYVTSDMEAGVEELLQRLSEREGFARKADGRNVQRLICDSQVGDHHAILPTRRSLQEDPRELTEKSRNIYRLITCRLVEAACGPKRTEETLVEVTCAGEVFEAKGTRVTDEGFSAVSEAFKEEYLSQDNKRKKSVDPEKEISVVNIIDDVFEGKTLENHSAVKTKRFTSPPKPFTEDSLLAAMESAGRAEMEADVERKGIGTPATRAAIIEKLVAAGYVRRSGRRMIPTDEGTMLVSVLPDKLKSASLTAAWENRLLAVEKGSAKAGSFMEDIIAHVEEAVDEVGSREETVDTGKRKTLGKCPKCGAEVVKGKYGAYCTQKCGMGFKVYGYSVNDEKLAALLEGRPIILERKSRKNGKIYKLTLAPDGTEEYSYEKDGELKSGYRFRFKSDLVV